MSEQTPHRILIVDDEPDTCASSSDILVDLGYKVDTATSGEAGSELVRSKRYDVALLDFKLPGMDGVASYRKLRELQSGTAAIIVTAYAGSATLSDAVICDPRSLPAALAGQAGTMIRQGR